MDLIRPINPLSDSIFGSALALLQDQGIEDENCLRGLRSKPTNTYIIGVEADEPAHFLSERFAGSVRAHGQRPQTGMRFGQISDQSYFERYVYPDYATAKADGLPMGHFIRTQLLGHATQYRRLIVPLADQRKTVSKLLVLSWIDYFVKADLDKAAALSPRQQECLLLLANGERVKSIAFSLGISENMVERHIDAAKEKLGARSATHAVSIALLGGLLAPVST